MIKTPTSGIRTKKPMDIWPNLRSPDRNGGNTIGDLTMAKYPMLTC